MLKFFPFCSHYLFYPYVMIVSCYAYLILYRCEKLASRQNDQKQTSRVLSVEGTATPASDFPVTPVAVKDKKEYSPRAQLHCLSRLIDAYTTILNSEIDLL